MQHKHFAFAAAAALALGAVSCSEPTSFTLDGTFASAQPGDKVYLATEDPLGGLTPADTLDIIDGRFHLEGEQEYPALYFALVIRRGEGDSDELAGAAHFVLENAQIELELTTAQEAENLVFSRPAKAGPTQRLAEEFVFGIDDIQKKANARQLMETINHSDTATPQEVEAAVAAIDSLQIQTANFTIDFLMRHADEPVAQTFFRTALNIVNRDQAKALASAIRQSDKLNPELEPLLKYVETYADEEGEDMVEYGDPVEDSTYIEEYME